MVSRLGHKHLFLGPSFTALETQPGFRGGLYEKHRCSASPTHLVRQEKQVRLITARAALRTQLPAPHTLPRSARVPGLQGDRARSLTPQLSIKMDKHICTDISVFDSG